LKGVFVRRGEEMGIMNSKHGFDIQIAFDKALAYIINVLIVFIIVVLIVGLGKTIYTVKDLISGEPLRLTLSHVVADILSFLVMIELFRSFVEYFKSKRIRLHSMIDPAIIFIVRELIVRLYTHEGQAESTLVGFAILLASLGAVRTLAVLFSPEGEQS
jgi:uncharacterized membrane protein (DUF373 family)